MNLTKSELEDICVAIMRMKTWDGKYCLRNSEVANDIFREFILTGHVEFHIIESEPPQ